MEFHGVRFDLRKVEDVRNQAQQLVSVARYEPAVLLLLRLAERDVFAGEQVGEADDGVEGRAYLVAHVGQKRAFQPVALPRLVAGCAQSVFGGLVGVDALAYPHDAVGRSVAGLSEVYGLLLEPLPRTVTAPEPVRERVGIHLSCELFCEGVGQPAAVFGMHEPEEIFGADRAVARRKTQVGEPALVDDHPVVAEVEKPREYLRLRQGHAEDEFAGDLLLGVAEQKDDPAQLPPPVVTADETAFDVEFQVGVPKPDIAPWRQVSVAVPFPEPGENAGQKVLPVVTDRKDVGGVQRM